MCGLCTLLSFSEKKNNHDRRKKIKLKKRKKNSNYTSREKRVCWNRISASLNDRHGETFSQVHFAPHIFLDATNTDRAEHTFSSPQRGGMQIACSYRAMYSWGEPGEK